MYTAYKIFRFKETYRLKTREWKNDIKCKWKRKKWEQKEKKKGRVKILMSDKIELKQIVIRDKEGHWTMIKISI